MIYRELHELIMHLASKSSLEIMDVVKLYEATKPHVPNKPMYIIELLRNGDRESHSYLGGVYSSYTVAINEAKEHVDDRAGKYCAEIHQFYPGSPNSLRLYRRYSQGDEL